MQTEIKISKITFKIISTVLGPLSSLGESVSKFNVAHLVLVLNSHVSPLALMWMALLNI